MVEKKMENLILTAQRSEITEHVVYQKLSQSATDSHNQSVLKQISDDELKQGGFAVGPSSGYTALLHGTEAIIPLNNPARASEVLGEAGLGGGVVMNVTVNQAPGQDAAAVVEAFRRELRKPTSGRRQDLQKIPPRRA